jgi:hypothetical protein
VVGVDVSVVTEMRVTRWAKYGHERLYVNTEDGVRVAWLDVKTGQTTLEIVEYADEVQAALTAHIGVANCTAIAEPIAAVGDPLAPPETSRVAAAPAVPTPSPEPVPVTPPASAAPLAEEPGWVDLAANRPGQAARAQAVLELAAMKDRTRVGTFLARLVDAKTDERAWRVGADGEETVGARLEKLIAHGWHVLHAVPVGTKGSDIDHVLVGPGGVYTLNTKTHPGGKIWVGQHAVKVNGHSVPYLRNSRFEAERASKLLTAAVGWPVLVKPVLVFLTGTLIPDVTIKQQPDDVVDRMDIPRAFKRAQERMTAQQVEEVFDWARRSTTWVAR